MLKAPLPWLRNYCLVLPTLSDCWREGTRKGVRKIRTCSAGTAVLSENQVSLRSSEILERFFSYAATELHMIETLLCKSHS